MKIFQRAIYGKCLNPSFILCLLAFISHGSLAKRMFAISIIEFLEIDLKKKYQRS